MLRFHAALLTGVALLGGCNQPATGDGDCPDGGACSSVEPERPKIYISPPFGLGFDCVMTGCDQAHQLTISNRGGGTVDLQRVSLSTETSADFTVELAEELPYSLAAGATLTVPVRYQPSDATPDDGLVRVVYTVTPGTGEDPDPIELPLRTRTLASPRVGLPNEELNFGFVNPGETLALALVVQNAAEQNAILVVSEAELEEGSDVEFSLLSGVPGIANAAEELQINIQFSPLLAADAARTYHGILHLKTNDPTHPDVQVRLVGTAREAPQLAFDPPLQGNVLDLGSTGVGSSLETTLQLRNLGGSDLLVIPELIDASGSGFTIEPSAGQLPAMGPFEYGSLLVRFTAVNGGPARGSGGRVPTLRLQTNDPGQLAVDIRLDAFGVLPHAQPNVDRVDFGGVVVGWQATPATVLLQNTGAGPLNVTNIFLEPGSNAQLTMELVPGLPAVLMPEDQPIKVTLHYSPVTLGLATGALVFQTDDTDSPLTRVQLTARGITCEEGCPIPHATPDCTFGSCEIDACEAGWHNADEVEVTGCECREDDGGDLGEICGQGERDFGRIPDDGTERSFSGTLHDASDTDIMWLYADDEGGAGQLFGDEFDVEIILLNTPPGVEMCIRESGHDVQGQGCGRGGEQCGVSRWTKDGSYGSDDDTDFTIKVRLTPGTAPFCANYTVRVKNG
ncbi:MAG: choice-of-anchor D domain-containing protein [Myxococcota bacterium]